MKLNLASIAAHDLKEPIRMISSFMSIIQERYASDMDEKGKQYVNYAIEGAKRMTTLISDLLEYAKIGSEKVPFERLKPEELLLEITALQETVLGEKNALISWDKMPDIYAQKTGLRLLLMNLIGNGNKYQKPGNQPEIHICFSDKEGFWEFMVMDNGIGIASQNYDKIFQLFSRLHNKSEFSGTGMGLATCKKIVEQHGGEIWVESREN